MKFIIAASLFVSIIAAAEIKKTINIPNATIAPKRALSEPSRPGHCHSNQFRCSDGQCINISLLCDRQNDCRDNSDESFSICAPGDRTTSTTTPRYLEINVDAESEFTCANGEFLCTSGECILQSRICDGRHDCRDGSDEGQSLCNTHGGDQRRCLATEFRCNSGECVHIGLKCDGSNDCYDSSDEDTLLCERITDRRNGHTERPDRGVVIPLESTTSDSWEHHKLSPCNVPAQPANGYWKLHRSQCDSGRECNPPENVRNMEPGTYLVYSCDQGFALNGSRDVLCGPGGQWVHEPQCNEIRCHYLSSSTTEALCTWNNVGVSCEIPAPIGTTAQLKCREGFVQEVMYEPTYRNVKCQPDGKWSPKHITCVKKPKKVQLVLTGDMIIED